MGDSLNGLSLDSVSGAYSKYSNTTVNTNGDDKSGYLDFDSYLKVLSAQMSNQDFNNPMSDSEMLQQMSSYSMLEGIKAMTTQASVSYATSLVGKAVTVNDGSQVATGVVESVTVNDSTPYLVINGSQFKTSAVTDISDSGVYSELKNYVGKTADATVTMDGKDTTVTGKITDVVIKNGKSYAVINDTLYSIDNIKVKDNSTSDTASNSTASTSNDTSEADNLPVETQENTAYASTSQYLSNYATKSDKLFDELLGTTNSVSNSKNVNKTAQSTLSELSQFNVKYVKTPDYAASLQSQNDEFLSLMSLYSNGEPDKSELKSIPASDVASNSVTDDDNSDEEEIFADELEDDNDDSNSGMKVTNGVTYGTTGLYDVPLDENNIDYISSTIRGGRVSGILTNDQAKNILSSDEYTTRFSTRYGLEVKSDNKPGITLGDSVPSRCDADKYPEEAALADKLGTRMFDIQYINNHDITSRIDTSNVIGTTISGREITEIGYSGVGQLGEVVTFADGTQRVEIIMKNGHSGWFNTSGKYTLDQICDFSSEGMQRASDLNPFESAIRAYAN